MNPLKGRETVNNSAANAMPNANVVNNVNNLNQVNQVANNTNVNKANNMNNVSAVNGKNDNPPKEKPTFFLSYVFIFISLGTRLLLKEGTNAFNPNTLIENVSTTDGKVPITKMNAEIEKKKERIRANPKFVKMKEKLASELQAEGIGQKLTDPVVFKYTVMDQKGKIVNGRFTGVSKMDVNSFLLNEGYEVFNIETSDMLNFIYGHSKILSLKMSNKDLIFWLTQLSTYIKAGIPLVDAVRILANQMGKGKESSKNQVFNAIVYELSMGTPFSEALEKQGNVFPSLLINMLKAAEATGDLESTLDEMADYYSEIEETKQQMKSAMTYPVLVLLFAMGITVFILTYIVPQFVSIYDEAGVTLSPLTVFLIDLSGFLKNYLVFLLAGIVAVVVVIILIYKNIQPVRKQMQIFAMHVPVFGKIIIYNEITIFTKTFASLLRSNVFITESIDILSKITTNEIFKEIMYETIGNIAVGDKISASFKDKWCVPDVAYFMIQTGESTGDLANMMQKVSDYYGGLHKSMIGQMKAFIEPVMIILIAVIVGGILIAVILPMFDLYDKISM